MPVSKINFRKLRKLQKRNEVQYLSQWEDRQDTHMHELMWTQYTIFTYIYKAIDICLAPCSTWLQSHYFICTYRILTLVYQYEYMYSHWFINNISVLTLDYQYTHIYVYSYWFINTHICTHIS